ncbi:MBL fold metallo-hydrolase [Sinomonas mesophila]|uniref:MBL fold metallo-hydrolase n=1 Tax=Sinomonas mesophila TaxID=1531955 RepID=UPI00098684CB|nr:MBL fold metallo-hydrolase [Sinomonas mesophila]
MKLTKYTHSCVRLSKASESSGTSGSSAERVLVIDPGNFSEVEEALDGAHALLVTHEHPDHVDIPRVAPVLAANAGLEAWAPDGVARSLREAAPEAAGRVHTVEPGAEFEAGSFPVRTFGSQHALIHASVPVVPNIGYLVDGTVFHPGDSFTVPHGVEVPTLLVPIHAPWSRVGEVLDFLIAVRPKRALPIHNALLNERGLGVVEKHVQRVSRQYGTEYTPLAPGGSTEL